MQVPPGSHPGPRFRRQPSSMGVAGFQGVSALAPAAVLKAHMVPGSVYSNGHSSTSLGQTAASPSSSSPLVARTVSPLHTNMTSVSSGHSALARPASPLKGQQGYVTRITSSSTNSVAPTGGGSQSNLVQRRPSPRTQPNSSSKAQPNNIGSPPVPGLFQPSPSKSVMRRSSCPPPIVRNGQGSKAASSNRPSTGHLMAKVVGAEPISPATGMRQVAAIVGSTANALQAQSSRSTAISKPLPAATTSPQRPARFSTGALTARSINGRGASTVSLSEIASPRSGNRSLLPSSWQSIGGLPLRASPREGGGANRRAISREEMITSGRLRQTTIGSPRARCSNGATKYISDPLIAPALERREAPSHDIGSLLRSTDSTTSVITLPGPLAESNDFASHAIGQDMDAVQNLADSRFRLVDVAQHHQETKEQIEVSPRSALTADVPTEPGTDLQNAELLSPRTEPPC